MPSSGLRRHPHAKHTCIYMYRIFKGMSFLRAYVEIPVLFTFGVLLCLSERDVGRAGGRGALRHKFCSCAIQGSVFTVVKHRVSLDRVSAILHCKSPKLHLLIFRREGDRHWYSMLTLKLEEPMHRYERTLRKRL